MDTLMTALDGGTYQVIVAGGGPAGVAAAITCGRSGLSTLLIEETGCLGGMSTGGALPFVLGTMTGSIPFLKMLEKGVSYRDAPRPRQAVAGIWSEVMDRINREGGGVGPAVPAQTDRYPALDRLGCHDEYTFDIETGKRVLDEMAMEADVDVLFFTTALRPDVEGRRIAGLYVINRDGLSYVRCDVVIDCTGDADVVERAGFSTQKGDPNTGCMTHVSLITHMENVDSGVLTSYLAEGGDPWFREQCARAISENPNIEFNDSIIMLPMIQDGVFMINGGCAFTGFDGTNAKDISALMRVGRVRAKQILDKVFKPYIPGFLNARIRMTAAYPGIRETRRIVAEYALTEEDLLVGKDFPDVVALAGRHFDLSTPTVKPDGSIQLTQPFHEKNLSVKGGITRIPYRCMVPKGTENIVAAGRCIAAQGQALGPVRIISTCYATGQAAGTAVSLAIEKRCRCIDVDVNSLKASLRRQGALIE